MRWACWASRRLSGCSAVDGRGYHRDMSVQMQRPPIAVDAERERPLALVVRAPGTNCDAEMVRAFRLAGADAELIHLDTLIDEPKRLDRAHLLGFPGGFSYGDDVASGRVFALRLRQRLYPPLRAAAGRGVAMIAACNGFQIIVQAGLLPGPYDGPFPESPAPQQVSLTFNEGGRFIDRWCGVEYDASSVCIWTRDLARAGLSGSARMLPIAHGEGRFVARDADVMAALKSRGMIAVRYANGDNPNASDDSVAGICDATGRIFGLMPHPERFLDWTRHPFWTRLSPAERAGDTPGLAMFRSAVSVVRAEMSNRAGS
jgi:phosphoribosylformylglycinamidine synthase I